MSLEAGDTANVTRLDCDVHVGTHVEAPRHFLKEGISIDRVLLDTLVGPAEVADLRGISVITPFDLDRLDLAPGTTRLLLRTRNSELWAADERKFQKDYVALSSEAARWITDYGIELIGVDYLSVQRFEEGPMTHQILMRAGVIIIEGLNLSAVESGRYELICLPLRLTDAEAAPARAALRPLHADSGMDEEKS